MIKGNVTIPRRRRQYTPIFSLTGGLRTDIPPVYLQPKFTPRCQDVLFRNGVLMKARGVSVFAGTDTTPLDGTVMLIDQFYKTDGTSILICLTTKHLYKYDTATQTFTQVGTLTFTGNEDDPFTVEIMNNLYIFSNGVDGIYKWDGVNDPTQLGGTSGWSAKVIKKFGERLCLYHTIESGNRYPQRCRWSVAGNPEDWTSTGSGYTDLYANLGVDWIKTVEQIGNYEVIYAERTIVLQGYKGDVNEPFDFTTRVSGIGAVAERGVVNLSGEHLFLSWDGFYSFTGGREVEIIDDYNRLYFLSIINPEYVTRSFSIYTEEKEEAIFYVPTITSTLPDTYLVYNLKNKSWSMGKRDLTGGGYYNLTTTLTIDEMTDSIDSYTWLRFDDTRVTAFAPLNLYGDSDGKVWQDNESTLHFKGNAIDGYWDTKDFVQGERYRAGGTYWCELNFEGRGNSVTVSCSVDGGSSWKVIKTVMLRSEWAMYRLDMEVYSSQIRFRFRNNNKGENFELRQIEVGFVGSSDRSVK